MNLLKLHDNELEKMMLSEAEHEKREKILQQQLSEMSGMVENFKDKLGTKTVKLKSLAEGLKRFAKVHGLEQGRVLLLSLSYILLGEKAWSDNVASLEEFFIEARKEREGRNVTMTGEHATYNENNNK